VRSAAAVPFQNSQETLVPKDAPDPVHHPTVCGTASGGFSTIAIAVGRTGEHPIPSVEPATDRVHRLWAAGDDDRIAAGYRLEAEAFVGRRRLGPGLRVLDAACGSGNAVIPAARTRASVTGVDLVGAALETASVRAAREGLVVSLDQGNVERLPYPDGAFDVVLSLFGVMFAARPDRVLGELARVTRAGGQVALASWTPGGFMGELFAIHAAHVPSPLDLPDPLHWGDPEMVAEWLEEGMWEVTTERRTLSLRYPHTSGGTAELFRAAHGPTVRAFESVDEDRRAVLAADLAAHWARHRRYAVAGTEVEAEFLEVTAVRR
jgi:2-polyprenyl-3-methyl-5-hydroxy-6-metoxy-1,4-benzoquinol methylase